MLGSAQPCLAAQAAAWWPTPQTRKAARIPAHPGARQTSPPTLDVVLRIKPLPAALVVAQRCHSSGVLAASFTASTKIPSISSLPVIPPLLPHSFQPRRWEVALPIFGGSRRTWLVTGEQAKDGHSSSAADRTRRPRYLERHFCPAPAPGRGNGHCGVALHLGWAEDVPPPAVPPASGMEASAPPRCSCSARGNL